MTPFGQIRLGTTARALAAALAIGATILSTSAGPVAAAPNQLDDDMCTMEDGGHIDFYLIGDRIMMPSGAIFECFGNDDGQANWDDGGELDEPVQLPRRGRGR
jgi:hypothetical protein